MVKIIILVVLAIILGSGFSQVFGQTADTLDVGAGAEGATLPVGGGNLAAINSASVTRKNLADKNISLDELENYLKILRGQLKVANAQKGKLEKITKQAGVDKAVKDTAFKQIPFYEKEISYINGMIASLEQSSKELDQALNEMKRLETEKARAEASAVEANRIAAQAEVEIAALNLNIETIDDAAIKSAQNRAIGAKKTIDVHQAKLDQAEADLAKKKEDVEQRLASATTSMTRAREYTGYLDDNTTELMKNLANAADSDPWANQTAYITPFVSATTAANAGTLAVSSQESAAAKIETKADNAVEEAKEKIDDADDKLDEAETVVSDFITKTYLMEWTSGLLESDLFCAAVGECSSKSGKRKTLKRNKKYESGRFNDRLNKIEPVKKPAVESVE